MEGIRCNVDWIAANAGNLVDELEEEEEITCEGADTSPLDVGADEAEAAGDSTGTFCLFDVDDDDGRKRLNIIDCDKPPCLGTGA